MTQISDTANKIELLKPEEVWEMLKISPNTLTNMYKDGRLARIEVAPRIFRYRKSDIEAIMQGRLPRTLDNKGYMTPHSTEMINRQRRRREAAQQGK
jgi:predicted DNA-binding transcriptional regulator AlpA